MQKVVYSISKVNKDEKLKGVGYLIEGNLLIPSTSSKGNAYIEAQISQYDFDIEQARQHNYSYLTPEKIKDYFRKVICGDITADSTREHIIKYFIREIILYEDCLVITYNFTDKNIMKKTTPDDIDEVENELKRAKSADYDTNLCLYKRPNSPPVET